MNVQVLSVREAPGGFGDDVLALVQFQYFPGQFDGPVGVTRWSSKNEKEYTVAKISGAAAVLIMDAQLREGKTGTYLTTNPVAVPDDVRREAAKLATPMYLKQKPADKPAAATPPAGWSEAPTR